jgi:hypothetical protein
MLSLPRLALRRTSRAATKVRAWLGARLQEAELGDFQLVIRAGRHFLGMGTIEGSHSMHGPVAVPDRAPIRAATPVTPQNHGEARVTEGSEHHAVLDTRALEDDLVRLRDQANRYEQYGLLVRSLEHSIAEALRAALFRLEAAELEQRSKEVTHPHMAEHLRKRTGEARDAVRNLERKLARAAADFGFRAPASNRP